jgi:hypothetical protein
VLHSPHGVRCGQYVSQSSNLPLWQPWQHPAPLLLLQQLPLALQAGPAGPTGLGLASLIGAAMGSAARTAAAPQSNSAAVIAAPKNFIRPPSVLARREESASPRHAAQPAESSPTASAFLGPEGQRN